MAYSGAILLPLAASLVGAWLAWTLSLAGLVVVVWAVWFFRDPARRVPTAPGLFVSPADGVVSAVAQVELPPEVREVAPAPPAAPRRTRISVFMNIFNVHVNRAPEAGVVERIAYTPGRFFNASLDKASEFNERCALVLRTPAGERVVFVQIAGLVARRIVCRVNEGAALARGERFGLIRFGSRVDIYLPDGATPAVQVGQRVTAGETVLARSAPQRGEAS